MFPTAVDQNRQENGHPQLLHLYMHCCPCSGVLYNSYSSASYRPHFIAYQPRPYNLHHYQYTQFNMSPYNLPIAPTGAVVTPTSYQAPPSPHQNTSTVDLPFGPPPRDRRNLDRQESDVAQATPSSSEDKPFDLHDAHPDFGLNDSNLCHSPPQITTHSTFLKFLESSCLAADQIAYRNRNRPCFRNIQNLCIRTRNEILKPSTTISNIHSQGIPWATKDFIYAFIRLTNCWQILKGYLENKEGNLGKIEKELTPEFKACYAKWEKDSMDLASHLTRIFCNLDTNISNPTNNSSCSNMQNVAQSASHISLLRSNSTQSSPKTRQQSEIITTMSSQPSKDTLKGVRGIIHIPQVASETAEAASSSENSPRDEDSDNERVYMKPGSYNVPKKSNSVDNSPRSIEFLDTAQNVRPGSKKSKIFEIPIEKLTNIQELNPTINNRIMDEDIWINAENNDSNVRTLLNITENSEPDVQTWVNNSTFEFQVPPEDMHEKMSYFSKPVSLLQRPKHSDEASLSRDTLSFASKASKSSNSMQDSFLDLGYFKNTSAVNKIQSRTYRKRNDASNDKGGGKFYSYKKNSLCSYDQRQENLNDNCVLQCEDIVNQLRSTEINIKLLMERCNNEVESEHNYRNATNLDTVNLKLKNGNYKNLNEIIHDFRHIVTYLQAIFEDHPEIMAEISSFSRQIDIALSDAFPNVDFSNITGQPDEDLGPIQYKKTKKLADGDGDH